MDFVDVQRSLALLLALVVAVLVRRVAVRRGAEAVGLEALVAGLLLGPIGLFAGPTGNPIDALLHELSPLMSFAIGAVGLTAGLHLRVAALRARPRESVRITNIVALVTGALVALAMYGALYIIRDPEGALVEAAAILAAASLLAAPHAVAVLRQRDRAAGPVSDLLEHVAGYSQVYGVIVFGLATAMLHVGDTSLAGRTLVPVEWAVVNVGAGVIVGLLFSWFLGARLQSADALAVTFLGMILFGAGLSLSLNLSPLLTCLAIGATVVNTSPAHAGLASVAARIQGAVFVVLVFFTAAVWRWPEPILWILVPAFILARLFGRWVGGQLAAFACPSRAERSIRSVGTSLLGMSAITLAVALSTWQLHGAASDVTHVVVTCLVVGGLANELPGRRLVRNVLIDAGEVGAVAAARTRSEGVE
ncbi:MAG: hypothetical protein CVU56_17085 [Deltaproteobacteria bacterium HGW-Deltaproteobacteria-14]|jgi:hypothetical protein|nr:MAG: hypothetical protein CVU56_17085 [Deltaproteobacteria bacterium HGW-Deltaproteobacteria-14]